MPVVGRGLQAVTRICAHRRKDGFYEHPADSFLYNVTTFAPPDAAALAGAVRHPGAERDARRLLERTGHHDAAAVDVTKMATQILMARARNAEEKAEWKALRRAQRDDGESCQWSGTQRMGRGGY
jgi:hypothetical protein